MKFQESRKRVRSHSFWKTDGFREKREASDFLSTRRAGKDDWNRTRI